KTLYYLQFTGRSPHQLALVEAYAREQGLFHDENTPEAAYSEVVELDLSTVEPSVAGPSRPQDRVRLREVAPGFRKVLQAMTKPSSNGSNKGGTSLAMAAEPATATATLDSPSTMMEGELNLDH